MARHFAEFLGFSAQFWMISGVDKAPDNGQHAQIGIHLGSGNSRHADDINENLKHKSSAAAFSAEPEPERRR
jgi:hypothetical protein